MTCAERAEECREAFDALKPDLRAALELAAQRIRAFHEKQLPKNRDETDDLGVRMGAKWRAVDAAGRIRRFSAAPAASA